jgi:Transposase DDE domain group 1
MEKIERQVAREVSKGPAGSDHEPDIRTACNGGTLAARHPGAFKEGTVSVVRCYNRRGTAEQWMKEAKQAVAMTRLSSHRFRTNEVRLWLSVLAYNRGNLWRGLALPAHVVNWSLTSLQQRLVKTGG